MTTHHMGDGLHSPCGLEPASVYHGFQGGFSSDWDDVDCAICLDKKPTDVRPSVPADSSQLQVFMTHDVVIDAFMRWVTSQGWELKLIPRFGESDDTYVPTHMIVPANLDALMRESAAEYKARIEGPPAMTDVRTSLLPFYLTFGVQYSRTACGHYGVETHPYWAGADSKGWVRIMARTAEQARNLAHAFFGERYAFLYPEDRFDTTADRQYYPLGELAVIELGNLAIEGDGPMPIVSTSDPELYGVTRDATVACRIEGELPSHFPLEPGTSDVELVHRTCLERGKELFLSIDTIDTNVMAYELDWAVPHECPVCHTSIT